MKTAGIRVLVTGGRDYVGAVTFGLKLRDIRLSMDMRQNRLAEDLGFTPQYLSDIEAGRRLPSVEFVERLCAYLGRGPLGRREWHLAAAAAHGWDVADV